MYMCVHVRACVGVLVWYTCKCFAFVRDACVRACAYLFVHVCVCVSVCACVLACICVRLSGTKVCTCFFCTCPFLRCCMSSCTRAHACVHLHRHVWICAELNFWVTICSCMLRSRCF